MRHQSHDLRETAGGFFCKECGESESEFLEGPCKCTEIDDLDFSFIAILLTRLSMDDPETNRCRSKLFMYNSQQYERQARAIRRWMRVRAVFGNQK